MSAFPSLTDIQEFFFVAMLEGWAANAPKRAVPQMPGYKALEFQRGLWRLHDTWCVRPGSDYSAGTTTIWFEDLPVWLMQYAGSYPKDVMALVKRSLHDAYQHALFMGGRGLGQYDDPDNDVRYRNVPLKNDFAHFNGGEQVLCRSTGQQIGYHNYQGMALR